MSNKNNKLKIGVSRAKVNLSFIENQLKHNATTEENDQKNTDPNKKIASTVVVAFYRPAGNSNRSGQFALNVAKPLIEIMNGTTTR